MDNQSYLLSYRLWNVARTEFIKHYVLVHGCTSIDDAKEKFKARFDKPIADSTNIICGYTDLFNETLV
jgi:hypothetical protein